MESIHYIAVTGETSLLLCLGRLDKSFANDTSLLCEAHLARAI